MVDGQSPLSQRDIKDRIEKVGQYAWIVRIGFAIIVTAFLLAVFTVLPANFDTIAEAVDSILLPLIFVGIGLLLFVIAKHLHLLHLNLILQLRKQSDQTEQNAENEG